MVINLLVVVLGKTPGGQSLQSTMKMFVLLTCDECDQVISTELLVMFEKSNDEGTSGISKKELVVNTL